MEESRWTDERQENDKKIKKRESSESQKEGETVFENIEQRILVNTHTHTLTSMRNIRTQADTQQPSRCKADTRQARG